MSTVPSPHKHRARDRPRRHLWLALLVPLMLALAGLALSLGPAAVSEDHGPLEEPRTLTRSVTSVPASTLAQAEDPEDPPEEEVVDPVVPLFEVEGRLTAQTFDPDPATSGIQGTLTVNGFTFSVPVGVPVRVGDGPGEFMNFSDVSQPPPGYDSLVNRSTIIATGTGTFVNGEDVTEGVHWLADDVFLEEAENVMFGLVTESGDLHVNDVRIVLETDPRFAPFNRVADEAGQPLELDEIPLGALASLEGVFRGPEFHARIIELEGIVPPGEGEDDFLLVDRSQFRDVRGELRVRGVGNNVSATLSIYEWDGARGPLVASGIVIGIDGAWDFRSRGLVIASDPPMFEVVSTGGASVVFTPDIR